MSLVLSLRFAALHILFLFFATAASCHVLLPIERRSSTSPSLSPSLPISSSGHAFVVKVTVGTPPQQLSLLLSPSSPHTWVPKGEGMSCNQAFDSISLFHPASGTGSACRWGAFTSSQSSTKKDVDGVFVNFVVAYTDTITVTGINITDTLKVGDIELKDFSMGLVDTVPNQQWIGMLGLGNDATTLYPNPSSMKYRPNFIDTLVSTGKINSQAYSIWLDNPSGSSGSLLLGAIDKSRYEGQLTRVNSIHPYDVFPSAFAVSLTGVKIDDSSKYNGPAIVASLSPAETFSYLPDDLAETIMAASGATWATDLQKVTIPCDAGTKNTKSSIRLQLEGPAGPVLHVRLADLVVPQEVTLWEVAMDTNKELPRNTCLFGIQKHPELRSNTKHGPQHNLGSSLLRRTYMVFDAANKDLAFAPMKYPAAEQPDIVQFDKQAARIPDSRYYCNRGDECLESNDPIPSDPDLDGIKTGEEKKNDDWKKIVIGVVVPIGVIAILAPIIYILIMRRRKREAERRQWSAPGKESQSSLQQTAEDGDDNFEEDEFGVKVTVSVATKVSNRNLKPPPSPSPSGSGSEMSMGLSANGSGAPRKQVWE
ncbi:putative aspartic protease [Podospora fimiseda]|uniref:Aspartic protease n=1 Tax=Podospora fimiseda TaxID=252190 RepID=A0AAN7GVN0_9PEZI|nr:putative aspartic protease [Podospora fimiseda]